MMQIEPQTPEDERKRRIKQRLRSKRMEMGFSQEECAYLMGFSQKQWSKYENPDNWWLFPPFDTLEKMGRCVQIKVEDLEAD